MLETSCTGSYILEFPCSVYMEISIQYNFYFASTLQFFSKTEKSSCLVNINLGKPLAQLSARVFKVCPNQKSEVVQWRRFWIEGNVSTQETGIEEY